MLECRELTVAYGQHRALDGVSLGIAPGEIVVILGANGAGKSTLLRAIAGLVPPAAASGIAIGGRPVAGLPPHEIVEAGLALVPEGRQLFGDLSVEENLLLGAYARRARAAERENLERVLALFPKLAERRAQVARTMSGGEQQMVAIGRALMSAPSVLMLDEPSLGLSPKLCTALFRTLAEVRRTGVGILLVEQNARQGLAIADRGYLLENGRIVGEGPAAALAQDPAVQKAYLGGAAATATGPEHAVERPSAQAAAPAVSAPPAAMPRFVPTPRADTLIPQSIDELARRAGEIQTEHVRAARGARATAAPIGAAHGIGTDTLSEALARIEAAAARARIREPEPKPRPASERGGASDADKGE
ncbi:MAG: ABC transporter ATP-binding protein [Burkholderiales bacterium]|nr:ABC transporter ATP-binding protein [Burkholderiales bacterium]